MFQSAPASAKDMEEVEIKESESKNIRNMLR